MKNDTNSASIILVVIICFAFCVVVEKTTAAEIEDRYFSVGLHQGTFDYDLVSNTFSPTAIVVKGGRQITPTFSVEGHALTGLNGHTVNENGYRIEGEILRAFSIFAKQSTEVHERAKVYGLIGWSKGQARATLVDFGISETESDSGFSYGAGVEIDLEDDFYANLDHITYMSEDYYTYSGFNLSIGKKF